MRQAGEEGLTVTAEHPDSQLERIDRFSEIMQSGQPLIRWEQDLRLDVDDPLRMGLYNFHNLRRQSGLYIDSDFARTVMNENDYSHISTDGFEPRRARVGHNSAHGVFFGDIKLSNGTVLSAAIKPHQNLEDNEKSALTDLLNAYIVERYGFYTLRPIGVLMPIGDRRHEASYSITVLDEGLTTFDSINWSQFAKDSGANPGMRELWRSVANQLAVLHNLGQASHGDLAARNIASSGNVGAFFIDWEKARFSGVAPRDAETRYQFSYPDLSALLESISRSPHDSFKPGIGLLRPEIEDWWEVFSEIFFDEYITTRNVLVEIGRPGRQEVKDIKDELEVLGSTLKEDCLMFKEIAESQALHTD